MKSELGLETIGRNISKSLSESFDRTGIMYRLFYRVKSASSIQKKVKAKQYGLQADKLTDLIGIRITLYFPDDVELIQEKLMNEPNYKNLSKDDVKVDEFKPVRCNLVFNFLDENKGEVLKIIDKDIDIIDTTYEIQLRTVLSEGWHEVEHDLRYKCKSDWDNHNDLNRNLNGILATLETSEFSMLQLFSELAHRHYKSKNIDAMIKSQFRIRFTETQLDENLNEYLNRNQPLIKEIHRISRTKLLNELFKSRFSLPLTMNHFIYILNYLFLKDETITKLGGEFVQEELETSFAKQEQLVNS